MKGFRVFIPILVLILSLAGRSAWGENQALLRLFESGDTAGILKILEADPQQLKAALGEGMTPLHYAAYTGNETVFDYLIKKGLDLHAKDKRGLTPVWFTVSGGRPVMLKKLIALGADLGVKDVWGDTLLFRAALAGNVELVQILLDQGFDPNEKNKNGETPVVRAAIGNSLAALKLLVSKGADLKASFKDPLLHMAAITGAEVVHYLLDRGFDIDEKNAKGITPVWQATYRGNAEAVRALILRGADVNIPAADGTFPLQHAVKKGASDQVDLFIAHKADLDVVDGRMGKTMLHEAALRGNSALVKKLLAAGIPKDAKDKNGYTALSYALKYGHKTAAGVLRDAGVEEVPWETNLDDSSYLKEPLGGGEAYIWYLGHSGWALKTKSAFLVFDYQDRPVVPDEKLLANGHIRLAEFKGIPVYVFVSHEHHDHFSRPILDWKKEIPVITYIFGFEPDAADGIVSLGPRVQKQIGPLTVTTIHSNEAGSPSYSDFVGVGFAVQVDGLTIFHAGDHAHSLETAGQKFFPEIDFLAEKGIRPDIAFFFISYPHDSDAEAEARQQGIFYAVDKLKIKSVLPMHGNDREEVYARLVEGAAKNKVKVDVGAAVNRGDRFFFSKGALEKS